MQENQNTKPKKPRAKKSPTKNSRIPSPETGMAVGLTPAEAMEVVHRSQKMALEGLRLATTPTAALSTLSAVEASPADVTDELEKGGPAFGAFVKAVGLAVADAQQKLDETLVTTAKALSQTQIDVIAIFEQQLKDSDGTMDQGIVHIQKLPLINYLMPTAYQWSRVYLEADMKVKEFNGANGFNIKGKSNSFSVGASANYGVLTGGFGASGSINYRQSSFDYQGGTSFAQDEAAGSLHMEATLEPRADIQLPKPFILQKGPRLKVTADTRQDILDTGTPPKVIGRKITLTAELRDKANNLLGGKLLECRISEPLLNYTKTPSDGKTDANGQLKIEIKREGAAFDEKQPPQAVIVNVWFGLVNEQVVINI
jgi:hypothetical protein